MEDYTTIEYNIPIRIKHYTDLSEADKQRIKIQTLNLWSGHFFEQIKSIGCSLTLQENSVEDIGGILETLGVFGVGISECLEVEQNGYQKPSEEFADELALSLVNKFKELPAEYQSSVLRLIGGVE